MKKQLTTIFFIFVVWGCTAMAQNSSFSRVDIYGKQILVRAYNDRKDIIFGYGNYPGASTNPNIGIERTTIATREPTNNILKVAELPVNYRVYDAQIVTLKEDGINSYVDICVFCGTRTVDNGEWIYDFFTGNLTWLSSIDSTGFVGFFYLTNSTIPNSNFINNVYVRDVENTKHLFKMAAYAEHLGQYNNICTKFEDNAVLDIVGLSANSTGTSCIARVRFYPECNGSIYWDNDIRMPEPDAGEIFTDITATDSNIVTTSIFSYDTQAVYLRKNGKELYPSSTFLSFSSTLYKLDLSSISDPTPPGTTYNAYFKKPIRVTHLSGNNAVVSFMGVNTPNSNNTCNGLFSFKVNLPNVDSGAYDGVAGTLVDVCRYKDTVASVALIELPDGDYQINTLKWGTYEPRRVLSLYDTTQSLQTIDTRVSCTGNQNLMIGGLIGHSIDRKWKLLDQEYFNNVFSPYCISNSVRNASKATITVSSAYGGIETTSYPNDPLTYPVTIIPKANTSVTATTLCP